MRDRIRTILTRTGEPSDMLVTLAEAKQHLHVDTTADDARITALIEAATAHLDGRDGILGRALRPQTWTVAAEGFPDVLGPISPYHSDVLAFPDAWRLPLPPTISVDQIAYTDVNGVDQVWASSNYDVVAGGHLGSIVMPVDGGSWPSTIEGRPNAARITFQAGYQSFDSPSTDAVPGTIRAAALMMVAALYDDPARVDIPAVVYTLAEPYRTRWTG